MSYQVVKISYKNKSDLESSSALLFDLGALGIEEKEEYLNVYFSEDVKIDLEFFSQALRKIAPEMMLNEDLLSLKDIDWNENWKHYFKPVEVGAFCVYPPWENPIPGLVKLIISPKMAFGTGTHETTQLILAQLSHLSLKNKSVLDAGCGSGILSIAASKSGASMVTGFDTDEVAIHNARENKKLNKETIAEFFTGDISKVINRKYDIILANINRTVLEKLCSSFYLLLLPDGHLVLSGILESEHRQLLSLYESHNFKLVEMKNKGEWQLLEFVRENTI